MGVSGGIPPAFCAARSGIKRTVQKKKVQRGEVPFEERGMGQMQKSVRRRLEEFQRSRDQGETGGDQEYISSSFR